MTINTVGELIDALQKFDRNLPILKSDECSVCYQPIVLCESMLFPVFKVVYPNGSQELLGSIPASEKTFDAVVL